MNKFPNIISRPDVLGGKPCIKNTRISVELILEWLGTGGTPEGIAHKHPLITLGQVQEAILYAAQFSKNEIIIDVHVAA